MDETEITNSEYRQFVNWVRDSVLRTALAIRAEEVMNSDDPASENSDGIREYAFIDKHIICLFMISGSLKMIFLNLMRSIMPSVN